jgi:hypothetical protein
MLVTTFLTSLVIVLCWHRPPVLALAFLLFFGSIEALYFWASLIKFLEGAWLPILLALILMSVMLVWHYTTIKKYEFDLHNKVTLEWLLALGDKLGMVRVVPGIGLVYTDLTSGVPANFSRFVTNLPAFHQVLVFVCVKSVPVPHVFAAERYLVSRVVPVHRAVRLPRRAPGRGLVRDGAGREPGHVYKAGRVVPVQRGQPGAGGGGASDRGGEQPAPGPRELRRPALGRAVHRGDARAGPEQHGRHELGGDEEARAVLHRQPPVERTSTWRRRWRRRGSPARRSSWATRTCSASPGRRSSSAWPWTSATTSCGATAGGRTSRCACRQRRCSRSAWCTCSEAIRTACTSNGSLNKNGPQHL